MTTTTMNPLSTLAFFSGEPVLLSIDGFINDEPVVGTKAVLTPHSIMHFFDHGMSVGDIITLMGFNLMEVLRHEFEVIPEEAVPDITWKGSITAALRMN